MSVLVTKLTGDDAIKVASFIRSPTSLVQASIGIGTAIEIASAAPAVSPETAPCALVA